MVGVIDLPFLTMCVVVILSDNYCISTNRLLMMTKDRISPPIGVQRRMTPAGSTLPLVRFGNEEQVHSSLSHSIFVFPSEH